MSKSKGNVTGPDELVERVRRGRRCASTSSSWAPPTRTWSGREDGIEGMARFMRRLWRVVHEVVESAPRVERRRTAAGPQGARDDRARQRRHRPALPVPHADLGGDGARERAVEATPAAPEARFAAETAVSLIQPYAPHIAEELWERAGPRAPVGAAVAGGRPGAARAGDVRARRAGERQGARPLRGRRRPARGRAGRAGARVGAGAGAPGRQARSGRRSSSRASSSTSSSASPWPGYLDAIGNTPLMRVRSCAPANGAELWLKLEYRTRPAR